MDYSFATGRFATPAFAAVYDYLVFSQTISTPSGLGIALIISGGIFISWREHLAKQKQTIQD